MCDELWCRCFSSGSGAEEEIKEEKRSELRVMGVETGELDEELCLPEREMCLSLSSGEIEYVE